MPFIRYTRDKRGYETTYVVHGYRSSQGPGRTRVLYLFRSPSHVTVGRRALDDEARVALEHTHPDLAFDWQALGREAESPRVEPVNQSWREGRATKPAQPAPVPAMAIDDQSVLGRTLGAAEAARLRARYKELLQRIARRARSPEERDQLMERVQRLNPDDWGDEMAVRAGVSTVEAEWEALGGALPQRRRGRRGGRRREGIEVTPSAPSSAIIVSSGEIDEVSEDVQVAGPDRDTGDPGNDTGFGGPGPGTVFRATTNYVSTDVVVRDKEGKFIPDLRRDEFKVFEDGVAQKIERFVSSIGGRSFTEIAPQTRTVSRSEGLILPPVRPKLDTSGRIFIIFIDDLHLQVGDTPRVKAALADIRDKLVHENDLVGFVSTGPSSIEINPAYDFGHRRFNEAIDKVMGAGMSINDIIEQARYEGKTGPVGLQHNAHNAFKTAYEMMQQLAQIPDRRKSFIYVSSGYTFDPFRDARYTKIQQLYQEMSDEPINGVNEIGLDTNRPIRGPYDVDTPLADQNYMQKTEFNEAELIGEIAQITREARRANVVFYTLDPRGLTAGMSIEVRGVNKYEDWRDYVNVTTNSLKVLGEETGGFCICQTNDYTKGLQRIDAETSDYYIVGYVSTNPDPFKILRKIKIEVTRPGVQQVLYRPAYTIPKPKKN